jgi:hypothetical protein
MILEREAGVGKSFKEMEYIPILTVLLQMWFEERL